MPMWVWIAIGAGGFLVVATVVAFVLARILGAVGREISALYEGELWADRAPTRATKYLSAPQPEESEVESLDPAETERHAEQCHEQPVPPRFHNT
jgi:hypothetical protein